MRVGARLLHAHPVHMDRKPTKGKLWLSWMLHWLVLVLGLFCTMYAREIEIMGYGGLAFIACAVIWLGGCGIILRRGRGGWQAALLTAEMALLAVVSNSWFSHWCFVGRYSAQLLDGSFASDGGEGGFIVSTVRRSQCSDGTCDFYWGGYFLTYHPEGVQAGAKHVIDANWSWARH